MSFLHLFEQSNNYEKFPFTFYFFFLFPSLELQLFIMRSAPINKPLAISKLKSTLVSITCPLVSLRVETGSLAVFHFQVRGARVVCSRRRINGVDQRISIWKSLTDFTVFGGTQSYLHIKWSLLSFHLMKFRSVCGTGPRDPSSQSMDSSSLCLIAWTLRHSSNMWTSKYPCEDAFLMSSKDCWLDIILAASNWAM